MQYSPKLKTAMQRIKIILEENDIAGYVVLHTPQFREYLLKIDPSYSCAKLEGDNLRIRAKKEDYNGDAGIRDEKIKNTVNMLMHLSEDTGKTALSLMDISEALDKIVDATHFGDGHTSHTTQNN